MLRALDDSLGRSAATWIEFVRVHARWVVLAFLLATAVAGGLSLRHLGLNSDEEALFSQELPFVRLRADFERAFPRFVDPIVVVIDGPTVDETDDAAAALEEHLAQDHAHFASVQRPGGGPFFEKHGLLYLDVKDLEELSDNLAAAQPFLAELSRDDSLRGFFGMLAKAVDAVAEGSYSEVDLPDVLDRVSAAVEAELEGRRQPLSWSEVILGQSDAPKERRRFVLVQPRLDFSQVAPAEGSIVALRKTIHELGLDSHQVGHARARTTGVYVLSYEESEHVTQQMRLAGAASFVLVAIVLMVALQSWRLVVASLATLLIGLALTAGFAAIAIGHLNLISVAFTVLFIGLSIDFAIHLCLRYLELVREGRSQAEALRTTATDIGGSLAICAATTAIGFYAFVPTAYTGVGELGLIAGTGMFISLFCNLSFLPALLALWGRPEHLRLGPERELPGAALLALPVRHARAVAAGTLLLTVARVSFDPNPLRLRDPTTESVRTFDELLADGMAFPWNVNVLVDTPAQAKAVAAKLEALPSVERVVTLADFVPEDQEEKIAILEDTALLMGPALETEDPREPPSSAQQETAIQRLAATLGRLDRAGTGTELARAAGRLRAALERFRKERLADGDGAAATALARLQHDLVGSLGERLRVLRSALGATPLDYADLPEELVDTMRATDGRLRVEVFPKEDLNDNAALERYVDQVKSVAPDAFGEGVVILESGRAVVSALQEALVLAAVLIFALLLVLWRSVVDALLVALPLALAALFTAALSVLAGISLNFANVIVLPLLLGMGVDSGIHLVHRMRATALPEGNLLRTTAARAVLYSALTTIASFGTLAFSSHPGMASLGQLLTIGLALILLCNLGVLPALAVLRGLGPRDTPSAGPS
jgi:uncharacterized protein